MTRHRIGTLKDLAREMNFDLDALSGLVLSTITLFEEVKKSLQNLRHFSTVPHWSRDIRLYPESWKDTMLRIFKVYKYKVSFQ